MNAPPPILDRAQVLRYAILDRGVTRTVATIHRVRSVVMGPAEALAICTYADENGYYLFYCDSEWNVVTDTFHESLERAIHQAEYEYMGLAFSWQETTT